MIAIILFIFLHRRHVRRLRAEDANYKHKSLDFGIEPSTTAAAGKRKNRNRGSEMAVTDYNTEKAIRRGRGLSMDMGSPYLLPPGLQSSRESLHSLSRHQSGDDRYRPATTIFGNNTPAKLSKASSKRSDDGSSSYTGSSGRGYGQEGVKKSLLRNAQRMSRSVPPKQHDTLMSDGNVAPLQIPGKAVEISRKGVSPQPRPPGLAVTTQPDPRDSCMSDGAGIRRSNNYLGAFIHSRDASADLHSKAQAPPPLAPESLPSSPPPVHSPGPSRGPTPPAPNTSVEGSRPPRLQSLQSVQAPVQHVGSSVAGSRPPRLQSLQSMEAPLQPAGSSAEVSRPPRLQSLPSVQSVQAPVQHVGSSAEDSRPPRIQSMQPPLQLVTQQNVLDEGSDYGDGFKVTPPSPILEVEDQRSEAPQSPVDAPVLATDPQTHGHLEANDLGHDARRLSMGVRPLPPDDPSDNPEQRANRIRSFYKEYFDESKRAPAQASEGYYEDYNQEYLGNAAVYDSMAGQFVAENPRPYVEPMTRRAMTPPPRAPPRFHGGQRHHAAMSSMSSPRFMSPGPRTFSSASAPFGPPSRGPPRKANPPPAPLRVLPTPHLLQEDSFALPIDFAPPTSYKDRRAGTPTSPRGGMLPYSPSLPAHMPLASSFQDLAVMPSP